MRFPFDLARRTLAAAAFVGLLASGAVAAPASDDNAPPNGHLKECHGYIRHISDLNIKVHCIDGTPSDQSFLYFPRYAKLRDGKSIEIKLLHPDTPVRVLYSDSFGVKKAHTIYVTDQNGLGLSTLHT